MLRIALVDDDSADRRDLESLLLAYRRSRGVDLTVEAFSDGDDVATNYPGSWDVLFLDVEMRFMDGLAAAERIRSRDSEVTLILVSRNPRYAVQGYSVEALDFVVKPLSEAAVFRTLDRAVDRWRHRRAQTITLRRHHDVWKLDVRGLWFVEVLDHDLTFVTAEKIHKIPGTLSEIEAALAKEPFFRCHKAFLVNLDHVDGLEGDQILIHDRKVPLSRARKASFLERLNEQMGGGFR